MTSRIAHHHAVDAEHARAADVATALTGRYGVSETQSNRPSADTSEEMRRHRSSAGGLFALTSARSPAQSKQYALSRCTAAQASAGCSPPQLQEG